MTGEDVTKIKAIKASIAKWKRIVRSTQAEDSGTKNCALCLLYYTNNDRCVGCPVSEHTGKAGCAGSPYDDWFDEMNFRHKGMAWPKRRVPYCPDCLQIAREEVAFLEMILEKELKKTGG